MNRSYYGLLFVVVLLMTFSCANPCQKRYAATHIKDNIYLINIEENGFTPRATLDSYFHQRANDLCVQNGFSDYKVIASGPAKHSGLGIKPFSTLFHIGIVEQICGESGYVECLKKE